MFALLRRYLTATVDTRQQTAAAVQRYMDDIVYFIMCTVLVSQKFEPSRFEIPFTTTLAVAFSNTTVLAEVDLMSALIACDAVGVVDNHRFIEVVESLDI